MNVKVSIIVAIYHVEKYLETCLKSICNQTYRNIEVILVVQGIDDRCSEICEEYSKNDDRVKIIFSEKGLGLARARLTGLEQATGDYIYNVDGDDWLECTCVEKMICGHYDEQPDMIIMTDAYFEKKEGTIINKGIVLKNQFKGEEIVSELLPMVSVGKKILPVSVWKIFVRYELAIQISKKMDPDLCYVEDQVFIFLWIMNSQYVKIINDCLYHYRFQDGTLRTAILDSMQVKKVYSCLSNELLQKKPSLNNEQYIIAREYIQNLTLFLSLTKEYQILEGIGFDFVFPFVDVAFGKRVVIYGAGMYGRSLVHFIKKHNLCRIQCCMDKDYERIKEVEGESVVSPDQIGQMEFDYILIAVTAYSTAERIKENLVQNGIDSSKICTFKLDAKLFKMIDFEKYYFNYE